MRKVYKFAALNVQADFSHDYLLNQCKDYECSELPDFAIAVAQSDIDRERELNSDAFLYSDPYLESLALYRKFAVAALNFNVLLFHGSAVAFDGKAYIYTAPSGVGKSTHTNLCKRVFGDRISYINDDKPLLRKVDSTWFAYGSPWDGKHHLSSNSFAPLGGICLLNRGEVNSISKVCKLDSLGVLLGQTFRPDSSSDLAKTLQLVLSLANVPTWSLFCNISNNAAVLSIGTMGGFNSL